jgi:hypothetical protein
MIIIPRHIIPPPLREWNRRPAGPKHRKAQDEQTSQTRAIKCARNQVTVVLEDARAVVAQVELRVEADNCPAEEHAGLGLVVRNVPGVLDKLREVDLIDGEVADFGDELGNVSRGDLMMWQRVNVLVRKCGVQLRCRRRSEDQRVRLSRRFLACRYRRQVPMWRH